LKFFQSELLSQTFQKESGKTFTTCKDLKSIILLPCKKKKLELNNKSLFKKENSLKWNQTLMLKKSI